jgi:hypothetical protein
LPACKQRIDEFKVPKEDALGAIIAMVGKVVKVESDKEFRAIHEQRQGERAEEDNDP